MLKNMFDKKIKIELTYVVCENCSVINREITKPVFDKYQ